MSANKNRREFLADVGRGTLIAAVGSSTATDLGLARAAAAEGPAAERLTFGELEGLVALMQETPANRIVPAVIAESKRGTEPRSDWSRRRRWPMLARSAAKIMSAFTP